MPDKTRMTVAELIAELQKLPQDYAVAVEASPSEYPCYNVFFDARSIRVYEPQRMVVLVELNVN